MALFFMSATARDLKILSCQWDQCSGMLSITSGEFCLKDLSSEFSTFEDVSSSVLISLIFGSSLGFHFSLPLNPF